MGLGSSTEEYANFSTGDLMCKISTLLSLDLVKEVKTCLNLLMMRLTADSRGTIIEIKNSGNWQKIFYELVLWRQKSKKIANCSLEILETILI